MCVYFCMHEYLCVCMRWRYLFVYVRVTFYILSTTTTLTVVTNLSNNQIINDFSQLAEKEC